MSEGFSMFPTAPAAAPTAPVQDARTQAKADPLDASFNNRKPAPSHPTTPTKNGGNLSKVAAEVEKKPMAQAPLEAATEQPADLEPESTELDPEAEFLEKKLKIKINGQEQEASIAQIKQMAELAAGAHQKFQEAARVQKEMAPKIQAAEQLAGLVHGLTQNPASIEEFGAQLGVDFEAHFEAKFIKKLQRMGLPEHERRALDLEEENARLKSERENWEKRQQSEKQAAMDAQQYQQDLSEFQQFFTGKEVPKPVLRQTLLELRFNNNLTVEQAYNKALQEFDGYESWKRTKLTPQDIPKNVLDEARKANIAKVRQAPRAPQNQQPQSQSKPQSLSTDDLFNSLDKRYK